MVRPWYSLPREVVVALSLETVNVSLGRALSNCAGCKIKITVIYCFIGTVFMPGFIRTSVVSSYCC